MKDVRTVKKIVVDSDVIADHLTTSDEVSLLRKLMRQFFCYTTVFNAVELFSEAKNSKERKAVEDALSAMKILGLNSKSAKNIAQIFSRNQNSAAGFIAGVCAESRLPIVTLHPERFNGEKKISILTPNDILI